MRSVFRLSNSFSSKKLGIADTAKVIQDKIMNITQVVSQISYIIRMMLNNSERSSVLETVLPESSASTRSKQVRWSSLGQAFEAWP
jgi:hypothetical protein